jgi:hypothetical protein
VAVDTNRSGRVGFSHVLHILIDVFEIMEDEQLIDLRQQSRPAKDREAI